MAKNLILWVVIAVVLMSVFQSFGPSDKSKNQVDYSTFVEAVGQDQVKQATFDQSKISFTKSDDSKFVTYIPSIGDNKIMDDLINHNVSVKGTDPFDF